MIKPLLPPENEAHRLLSDAGSCSADHSSTAQASTKQTELYIKQVWCLILFKKTLQAQVVDILYMQSI